MDSFKSPKIGIILGINLSGSREHNPWALGQAKKAPLSSGTRGEYIPATAEKMPKWASKAVTTFFFFFFLNLWIFVQQVNLLLRRTGGVSHLSTGGERRV
jgi:hypothetical protein